MRASRYITYFAILVAVLFAPSVLHAQESNNVLDEIIKMYRDTASSWRTPIVDAATRLFWILVVIDFVWTGIHLALEQAPLDKIVAEVIKRVMVIGFFYAILLYSGEWMGSIIDSFRNLASQANASAGGVTGGISPSNIFDLGLRIAGALTEQITFSELGESVVRALVAVIILVAFAVIAGLLLVALVELYIALNAAVILLGLGGSRWTSEYAIAYLRFVFSTGIKIFVMQLLIGVGQSFITTMNTNFDGNVTQSLVMLGASIVLLLLVKTIPDYLQSLVNGVTPGSAGSALIAGAAAAGGGAIGAAAGAAATGMGGAMAVKEAAALAGSQSQGSGSAGSSFGKIAMGTVKNLGGAMLGDLGAKMSGNVSHQHGNIGARMASKLKEERLSMPPPKSDVSENGGTDGSNPGPAAKSDSDTDQTSSQQTGGVPTLSIFDKRS